MLIAVSGFGLVLELGVMVWLRLELVFGVRLGCGKGRLVLGV